ncbi:MAG: DUF4199 domain-containing protein [Bacteroidota bacterium]
MKKIVLTYGLISGLIISGLMGLSILMYNNNPESSHSLILGYATMILGFSLIFVGVKNFRDKHHAGSITFGKAFLIGLYISLIASTFYVATWALEYKYVFPDFMEKYSVQMIAEVKKSGLDQAHVDAKLKEMQMYKDMYKNPLFFTLLTYVEILPVGLVLSLISALVLKKKK